MVGFVPDAGDIKTEDAWFLFGCVIFPGDEKRTLSRAPNAKVLSWKAQIAPG